MKSTGLRRTLRNRHMQMIALGSVIGAGLFVGSGVIIGSAGPAAAVMNLIILTAVLSALNSGLFASSRMLMALAAHGDAPAVFARLDGRGVPVPALLAGTVFAYAAVVMNYVSPDKVFAFLVNSYGTVAIFVYVLIAFSQLRLRRRLEQEAPERLLLRMWGFPHLTRLAIAAMLAIVAAMAFILNQRLPLLFGIVSVLAMLAGYGIRWIVHSARTKATGSAAKKNV